MSKIGLISHVATLYNVSHMFVHRYLRGSLEVIPYKRPKRPRLTIKMRENRMKLSKSSLRLDSQRLEQSIMVR